MTLKMICPGYNGGLIQGMPSGVQYWPDVNGIVTAQNLDINGLALLGFIADPAGVQVQYGGGAGLFGQSGMINRQVNAVAAPVNPGATGADNVMAVFSLPALSLDQALRGLDILAQGNYAANGNTKRVKLWWNATTAVVGSTITGGTLLADTGAVTTSGGGWKLRGQVFKRGILGANTQTCFGEDIVSGAVGVGISPPLDATAVESGAILIAVTANATTATTDVGQLLLEVTGFN